MNVPPPIGVLAHYNLLERLEPAGPGDLYRARDTEKGRTVTVRVLPADYLPDAAARAALLGRARDVARHSHPNVTTLFDSGEHEGHIYLVFEFLTGQPLRKEMAGRPMNVRRAVELTIQIAEAVADAHAADVVRGGLSPDSVIVTAKGHAKVPAFDLAARSGLGPGGGFLRDYDTPEEAAGEAPDDRSEIYSVGALLYEMLTTRRPAHQGPAAPSVANRHVIPELDDVLLKAVARSPEARYQSVVTLAAELRSVAARLGVRDLTSDEEDQSARRSAAGVRTVLILAVIAVLAALAWWATR